MIDLILLIIAFALLLIGSVTDFKVREVPDWVNYSGVVLGLGIRAMYSAYVWDYSYILAGLFGFGVFLVIALGMFYLGQWGGGDSKMLMGLGALLGLELKPDGMLIAFFVNMLFVGAAYGIFWSIYLAIRSKGRFVKHIKKMVKTKEYLKARNAVFMISVVAAVASFFFDFAIGAALVSAAIVLLVVFYSWVFLVSIERTSMFKMVPVENLTEGDWIVKDVVVDKKKICGPKDLGISKSQIRKLIALKRKGKIQKILIKEGMPFVPAFLLALFVAAIWGNIVLLFI